jgi:hypothetical protein
MIDPGRTADTPSDRTATRLQGVDAIVAMPQWYLNAQLGLLLKYGRTTTGAPLTGVSLHLSPADAPWLRGELSALAITVTVPGRPATVGFEMTFQSGTMTHDAGGCDIGGLRCGFLVDLTRAVADAALPPGAFGVEWLLNTLQAQGASAYDPAATCFPPSMPAAGVAAFPGLMTRYLGTGGHLLAYAVELPPGTAPAATNPATAIALTANRYRAASADPDLDTVTYAMMTRDRPFPPAIQPWWGNFVQPGDGVTDTWYGTGAIAKSAFIDHFVVPRLTTLVNAYWALLPNPDDLSIRYEPSYGVFTLTGFGATFGIGDITKRSHKSYRIDNDDIDYTIGYGTDLRFTPGTNTVVINRVTRFTFEFTRWYGIDGGAAYSRFRATYHIPQKITVAVLGAVDGRFQVAVTATTSEPEPGRVYADPYGWDIVSADGTLVDDADIVTLFDRVVGQVVAGALGPDMAVSVADALNGSPFVFPGADRLNIVHPVFNTEGDLLFGLSYKS